jgi:hypothetical protein
MSKFVTVSALMVLAVPALAQRPDQTTGASQAQAKRNPADKVICKTEETTGTRLGGHKVCATEQEWRELAEQTQAAVQKLEQQDSGICHEGRCN